MYDMVYDIYDVCVEGRGWAEMECKKEVQEGNKEREGGVKEWKKKGEEEEEG